ncbi:MAG: PocR ligand-binding domain-containing protein [Deltaproteobacteria bacterium]|jgi:ligand-binding sensor protein|nr:PocR ligand-binding domain-containing protein [Deltaproteobacteria bacterium]
MELQKLSEILDYFAKVSNQSIMLLDTAGGAHTRRFGLVGFCATALGSKKLGPYCRLIHELGASQASLFRDRFSYICPYGLLESVIPVYSESGLENYVVIGQAKCLSPPKGLIRLEQNLSSEEKLPGFDDLLAEMEKDPIAKAMFAALPEYDFATLDNFQTLLTKTIFALYPPVPPEKALQIPLEPLEGSSATIPNPHFILSMVSSLCNLSIVEKARRTNSLSLLLAEHLKSAIQTAGTELTTLDEEGKAISRYLAMQKMRYGDHLSFSVALPSELQGILVPVDTLLPFVERALCFGLYAREATLDVKLSFSLERDRIVFEILDNFSPIKKIEDSKVPFKENSELSYVEGRVALALKRLSSVFGEGSYLKSSALAGGGARTHVSFPRKKNIGAHPSPEAKKAHTSPKERSRCLGS